jgi:cell division protein FtsW (lipid II flippase)
MTPFRIKKFPLLPILGLVFIMIIIFQFDLKVIYSTLLPIASIIILCLILTKRKSAIN